MQVFYQHMSFLYFIAVFRCAIYEVSTARGDLSHMSASRPPRCKRTQRGLGGQEKKLLPEYGSDRENDEQSER